MKRGFIISLRSPIDSQTNGQHAMNRHQSLDGKVMVFWDSHRIIFIDYLKKGKTNDSDYYIALLERLKEEILENGPICKRKKCCFTWTMHRVTNQLKRWQNCMKWTSNFFRTLHTLLV